MAFAAVYIPEFPIVAWLRAEPAAQRQALAILEGAAPLERVVACNRVARNLGVAHGMGKVQAEAAGAIRFRARQISGEQEAFAGVLRCAEQFSPRIEAIASPENSYGGALRLAATLLIDRAGTETLFGTAERYAQRLYAALRTARFPARVATAHNAEASLLLALSYPGVTCADSKSLESKLAPLPVSALPCVEETLATFRRWGIRTLGELAQLPETGLISRLGQSGLRLQQLARGNAERLLVPETPEFALVESTAFDTPIEVLDSLLFILSPLLERLLRKAMNQAYALRAVRLVLQLEPSGAHELCVRPAVPTQNRDLLLKLLNLELQAHPPPAGIVALTLSAEPSHPQTPQRGLFQAQFPEPDRLDLLLARLRSIAGEDNVGSPQLSNSLCDDAFTIAAFRPSLSTISKQVRTPNRLAIRKLRPPQAVRIAMHGDEPRLLFWRGKKLTIAVVTGPWHSSGCWWDSNVWDKDEWDALIADPPQALRLMQEHASKAWFVVGFYD